MGKAYMERGAKGKTEENRASSVESTFYAKTGTDAFSGGREPFFGGAGTKLTGGPTAIDADRDLGHHTHYTTDEEDQAYEGILDNISKSDDRHKFLSALLSAQSNQSDELAHSAQWSADRDENTADANRGPVSRFFHNLLRRRR